MSGAAIGVALIAVVLLSGVLSNGSSAAKAGDLRLPLATPPAELVADRTLGRADAPVTMEIWSDFQCPACGILARLVEPRLITDYVVPGKLRLVYRDFSFIGAESVDAAVAARCAGEQGKFWHYHDYLFENQDGENKGAFSAATLAKIADAVGVDRTAWDRCIASDPPRQAVSSDTNEGNQLGVRQTPTLVLNGTKVVGVPAYDQLRAQIDALLPGGASPSATPGSGSTSATP